MNIMETMLNSFILWAGWIIIPVLMEIVPAVGSLAVLLKRRIRHRRIKKQLAYFPEISIIIPVYNSEGTLFDCIASINDSTYPNSSIRIFLVDNQGKDQSFSIFAACQEKFPDLKMQWMNALQGKSRALNLALYNSEGKYIINLDSDGRLEPSALCNLVTKFEGDPALNCMTGAILTQMDEINGYKRGPARLLRHLEFMEYAQAFLAGRSYASDMNAIYTLSGAFSAFRKSVLLNSWLYNTDTICEDTHLTFQMRYQKKERIEICEDAIFFVEPVEDLNKLYTQRQRWQRGSLEVANMFMDKNFKLRKVLSNINVKTLLYDHTFAFPRMIWYLALFCLMAEGYSAKTIFVSTGLIFLLYIMTGYLYFMSVMVFLRINRPVQRYYIRHWWCVMLLPAFNVMVFFMRMAGIINSIQTDSSWRTKNLSEERAAFKKGIASDFKRLTDGIGRLKRLVNEETTNEGK